MKIIFFNANETILDKKNQIVKGAQLALELLHKNHILTILYMKESDACLPPSIQELNFDGIISAGGSEFKSNFISNTCIPYNDVVISPYARSEAKAIARLLLDLDISLCEAAAFGCEKSDLAIFKEVGIAIAMGNSCDELKDAAQYITEPFDQNGIYQACEKLGFFSGELVNPSLLVENAYKELVENTNLSQEGILGYERFLIFEKWEWLKAFLSGKKIPPIQIDWQISSCCNLRCRWCVGNVVDDKNNYRKLLNTLSLQDVEHIAEQIATLSINGLSVDTVQFSGFTGEPLISWEKLALAIRILHEEGIRIGVFTNGTLMSAETWNILTMIESVHISLDGGPISWRDIKNPYDSEMTYTHVIENITGLCRTRMQNAGNGEINIGYTVTWDNFFELETVIQDVIKAGADSICIKQDITGTESCTKKADFNNIQKSICALENKYCTASFKVLIMNDVDLVEGRNKWLCRDGCYYRHFFCTIGSNSRVYPCDYQTLSGCPDFGSIMNYSFLSICRKKDSLWEKYVTHRDFQNICPPFAEVINPYLETVTDIKKRYGEKAIQLAFKQLRENY